MTPPESNRRLSPAFILCFSLLVASALLAGCAASQQPDSQRDADPLAHLIDQWGVRLKGVRLSAAGHLIDFRYQVTDPLKAEGMLRRGSEAYLIDEATGARLPVPVTKVGQLRGTGTKPQAGRVYAVLFSNNAKLVQKGSAVTVVIADFQAEHLIVE